MKKPFLLSVSILWVLGVSTLWAQPQFLHEKMVDLTHVLEKGMPQFSEQVHFLMNKLTDYSMGYFSNAVAMPEHIGTHVDAPLHFYADKKGLDQIELQDMVGYAVIVSVVEEAKKNPDYELTVEDLRRWEMKYGPIKKDSVVILRTGWESKWFRPKDFLNKDKKGIMHFPGFSCEVVDYLALNRAVRAIGTDTLSIDPGRSETFCAHKILLHANKYAIEGLTNLEKLPPKGSTLVVSPLKIGGGSGAPARVLAWVP